MRRITHIQLLPPKQELHIINISFKDVFEPLCLRFILHIMPYGKKCYNFFPKRLFSTVIARITWHNIVVQNKKGGFFYEYRQIYQKIYRYH